ncbi:hypothetical protein CBS101457_006131 [Exobasidium rhododendri]|nr:hypothetical protein CBS101457_006131 [Exobasidium rhododendri]
MDEIKKIPPVTRTLIFGTAGVTLPLLLKLVNPYAFLLWWPMVLKKWEIWRPVTCFFQGSGDIQLLFDLFMLLRNSTDLEVNLFYRKTADYTWALLIINALILVTNYPLQSTVLFSPFTMAIVYLWSRANPASSVSFFGMITCPAPYLPYAYLALDLLRGGLPLAIQSSTGIVSAYLYYFLKEVLPASNNGRGPRLLPSTPSFLRYLLPDSPDPATQGQAPPPGGSVRSTGWGGTAFAPAGRNWGDTPTASTSTSGGQTLNNQGGSLSATIRSWMPFGGSSGTSMGGSGTSNRRGEGPDREAMLAAAEARLRALRSNSIAGRNHAASALAQQAANSPEAQARQRRLATDSAATAAGSNLAAGTGGVSSGLQKNVSSNQVRRTAAAGGSSSNAFSFGQYDAGKSKKSDDDGEDEEQETASGSGGRVAEIRRAAGKKGDEAKGDATPAEPATYTWGTGRKLGD